MYFILGGKGEGEGGRGRGKGEGKRGIVRSKLGMYSIGLKTHTRLFAQTVFLLGSDFQSEHLVIDIFLLNNKYFNPLNTRRY